MPPCVHSVNAICATSLGFTQWTPRRGSPSTSNGQVGVATRGIFRSAESGSREEARFAAPTKSQAALAIPLRLKQPSLSRKALVGERRQHGRNPLRLGLSRSLALASAGSPRSGVRLVVGNDCSAGRSRGGPTEPLLPQPDAEDVDAHQGGARHVLSDQPLSRAPGQAHRPPICGRLKYCTARSCFSASERVLKVPRLRRFSVFGSIFREYSR